MISRPARNSTYYAGSLLLFCLLTEHLIGRGMSMCKKDGAHWRILNMHNSLRGPESGVSGKP